MEVRICDIFWNLFIILALLILINVIQLSKKCTELVDAEISRIETRLVRSSNSRDGHKEKHEVYVKYYYNGSTYESKLNCYHIGMYEGDKINLYINPNNPEETYAKTSQALIAILVLIIGVFILVMGLLYT